MNSHAGFVFHQEKPFFNNNMIVIRNGIDTKYFKPDLNLRQTTRKSLGIKNDKKVIIYVARMDPMKAHDKVLQIASLHPDIIFLIVGSKTNQIEAPKNIIGLDKEESDEILKKIFEHQARLELTCRFTWTENTVCIWDNRSVIHFAIADFYPGRGLGYERVMDRIAIEGDRPN